LFLQSIEKLLTGTLDGNPAINGQTLIDEVADDDIGQWKNSDWQEVRFDPSEWKIPHYNSKLYGGQQFERLLAEFKAVVEHQAIGEINADTIATTAGPMKLNTVNNATWAAADIAQRALTRQLSPLVDQLFKRAVAILVRLTSIADSMISNSRRKAHGATQEDLLDEIARFPNFTYHVKSLYTRFVEDTAEKCNKKCKDEFYSTRLIHWELNNLESTQFQVDPSPDAMLKKVADLASTTYERVKARVVKNVMLKTYNFLLVPMQNELWSEVQGAVTVFSDQELVELFDVNSSKSMLNSRIADAHDRESMYADKEEKFLKSSNSFAKANPKALDF